MLEDEQQNTKQPLKPDLLQSGLHSDARELDKRP